MLKLDNHTFWNLTPFEIAEMAEVHIEEENRLWEMEYEKVAWQTAMLMNATGNYNKTITPDMLLGKESQEDQMARMSPEQKKAELESLRSEFDESKSRVKRDYSENQKKLDDLMESFKKSKSKSGK